MSKVARNDLCKILALIQIKHLTSLTNYLSTKKCPCQLIVGRLTQMGRPANISLFHNQSFVLLFVTFETSFARVFLCLSTRKSTSKVRFFTHLVQSRLRAALKKGFDIIRKFLWGIVKSWCSLWWIPTNKLNIESILELKDYFCSSDK